MSSSKHMVSLGTNFSEVHEHQAEALRHDPNRTTLPTGGHLAPDVRAKVDAFSKMAVEALRRGSDPSLSKEENAEGMHQALAKAAHVMGEVAKAAGIDMKKHPELAEKLKHIAEMTNISQGSAGNGEVSQQLPNLH